MSALHTHQCGFSEDPKLKGCGHKFEHEGGSHLCPACGTGPWSWKLRDKDGQLPYPKGFKLRLNSDPETQDTVEEDDGVSEKDRRAFLELMVAKALFELIVELRGESDAKTNGN